MPESHPITVTSVTTTETPFTIVRATAVATVAAVATLVVPAALANRRAISIRNNNAAGGATVYIGDANVTNAVSHYALPPQTSYDAMAGPNCAIYYYSVAGGDDLDIIEWA